jgi:p-cumate 2,3-dioxygenase subunit alpha
MRETDFEGLIHDDKEGGLFRVDRRSFVDPDILAAERDKIFSRCWLYVGHESELKKPGDFLTRRVGGRPLLVTKGNDGVIRAFVNSCTHRGNPVALERSGNARTFTCFYHAWTFDSRGALIGVPADESYTDAFKKEDLGLKPVPRFESYRGMLFTCYDINSVDLKTYLGDEARKRIDYFIDAGADGGSEISSGTHSYSMKANWKLLVENSIDGYHALSTHRRYFQKYLPDIGMDPSKWMTQRGPGESRGRSLGNGHSVVESLDRGTPLTFHKKDELAAIRADMVERFGEDYTHLAADYQRNLLIFPNLILISMFKTVRTFYPVAPDFIEVDAWALFPQADSPDMRRRRLENFLSFQGPGGFATPDDVTGLEGCQRSFAARSELRWSDISRGMGLPDPSSTDELQMRAFWRKWHQVLSGEHGFAQCHDREDQQIDQALEERSIL